MGSLTVLPMVASQHAAGDAWSFLLNQFPVKPVSIASTTMPSKARLPNQQPLTRRPAHKGTAHLTNVPDHPGRCAGALEHLCSRF